MMRSRISRIHGFRGPSLGRQLYTLDTASKPYSCRADGNVEVRCREIGAIRVIACRSPRHRSLPNAINYLRESTMNGTADTMTREKHDWSRLRTAALRRNGTGSIRV